MSLRPRTETNRLSPSLCIDGRWALRPSAGGPAHPTASPCTLGASLDRMVEEATMAVLSILNAVNNQTGLPIVKNFTIPSGFPSSNLLIVSGSAWSSQTNVQLAVQVLVEDGVVGQMLVFSNGNNTHRAFAPVFLTVNLTPGTYTLTLRELDNSPTLTDFNDWFSVALVG